MAGNDYLALPPSTLTWNNGDPLAKTVTVAINGDTVTEPDETFTVNLSGAINATILKAQATGTIKNDDGDLVAPFDLTLDQPRNVADAVDIGDRGAAELHNDSSHFRATGQLEAEEDDCRGRGGPIHTGFRNGEARGECQRQECR